MYYQQVAFNNTKKINKFAMSGNGHKSGKQAEDARDPLKNHHSHINAILKKKQKRWMLIS